MKNTIFKLILATIAIFIFSFGVYTISKNYNQNTQQSKATSQNYIQEIENNKVENETLTFAFIDTNKTFKSNINTDSFQGISTPSISILSTYKDESTRILNDLNIQTEILEFNTFNELTISVKQENMVGFLPILSIEPQVKTLNFNGVDPFEISTFDKYELKTSTNKNIQEFNPKLITKLGHTGSMVAARWVEKFTREIHGGDYTPWFESTKEIFKSQDVTSSTWEAAMFGEGIPCDTCMSFVASEGFNEAVKQSEIDVFSLASNHIMDAGNAGLNRTKELLESNGQTHLGASDVNNYDALEPVLVETDNLKIAYIAFNDTPGWEQWATENKGGAANISDWIVSNGQTESFTLNKDRINETVERAEKFNPDVIVAIAHWSMVEYQAEPTAYVREIKDALVESGVDIIFGDQTHWVGEVELIDPIKNKNSDRIDELPVFYSVGNYIFDQEWSTETEQGMSVEVILYKNNIIGIKMHPHQLRLREKATVELLSPESNEFKQTLNRVFEVSDKL